MDVDDDVATTAADAYKESLVLGLLPSNRDQVA
jgi:hypothetical protein